SGDDVRRRRGAAVPQDAGRLDDPAVAVARPEAFGEPALGVEDPRPELLRSRVPADPLNARHDELASDPQFEASEEEGAVLRPVADGLNLALVVLVDPLAEQPLQVLQVLVSRLPVLLVGHWEVADVVLKPFAVDLDVGGDVPGARRLRARFVPTIFGR